MEKKRKENGKMQKGIEDSNILRYEPLITPSDLKSSIRSVRKAEATVRQSRLDIQNILRSDGDKRLLVVCGPCSIHDPDAAKDYSERLNDLSGKVNDNMLLVMRTYFEKPRTTLGWKGFAYDPYINGGDGINDGLKISRHLLLNNANMGLPSATEFLDPIVAQYFADLISYGAIGARTVESQIHRQMASGLSMPVGFKNSTSGNVQASVDAALTARNNHGFFGQDPHGVLSAVYTSGNKGSHIILRGGSSGPNYYIDNVNDALNLLRAANLPDRLVIDASHGNSGKDYAKQPIIFEYIIEQIVKRVPGSEGIAGIMLESNIVGGRQGENMPMTYGQSITDSCIGWDTTCELIMDAHKTLDAMRRG